ncbi:DUF4186 domain-containing protein [Hyphomicrobium sp.]|uniref:DUF4186 domain-containing protein n=1 Tax=Hyphomicrobium sp. TaxID=82 RepID=UPI0025BF9244|nr:DUF4186 domain-containing protein [Hyphomicrobium sp.]MCC7251451.1 DUF4186 domain-containing protein [Hyphomicrobium sp.]
MNEIEDILAKLSRSPFRRRFKLGREDRAYLISKGLEAVLDHAQGFIEKRLAPANPARDGKQTPFRGHPVFVAQHATATCCRGCLAKWHGIPRGHPLQPAETRFILALVECWLRRQLGNEPGPDQPRLL